LSSCLGRKIKIDDGGLISGNPCSAPCFLGILPGTTTKSQTISLLEQQDIYKFCNDNLDRGYISCDDQIYVYYNPKGSVSYITFTPTNLIAVKDFIDKRGPPDSVHKGIDDDIPENTSSGVSLLYDKLHIYLSLGHQDGMVFTLNQKTKIFYVRYYSDDAYSEMKKILSDYEVDWKGFTAY
jgi:hypothetical protein